MVQINVTTSPVDALQTVNDLTMVNGIQLLGTGILVFVWWIAYSRSKDRDQRGAIASATFFTSLVGIAMTMVGLLSDEIVGALIALTLISIYFILER